MIRLVSALARLTAGRPLPSPVPLPRGVDLRVSRLVTAIGGRVAGMGGPAAAVALGRVILLHPSTDPSPRLIRHELAHVHQWERQRLSFPLRYITAHIRHGYAGNPYEAEAREAEVGLQPPGETT